MISRSAESAERCSPGSPIASATQESRPAMVTMARVAAR